MSYQPRSRHAPPWDSSPRPRHEAPPRRHEAPPERGHLRDGLVLFWTIAAIVGTIGGVVIMTVLWPSALRS
jgi:hypothetical protein